MKIRLVLLVACGALGLLAAALATSASATGTTRIQDLPGLGYTLSQRGERVGNDYCNNYYVISGNGAPETLIGDMEHTYCTSAAVMQARIDALIAAYPPQPPTTTIAPAPVPTVTVSNTMTVTSPAVTVTTSAPAPVTTIVTATVAAASPPAETITVASPPVTVTQTTTRTVTVTRLVRPKVKPKRRHPRLTAASS